MARIAPLFRRELLLATTCLVAARPVAYAASVLPTGGSVAGGQATISQPTAQTTLIQQSSSKAIINWASFSVSSGSSVVFQQPDSSSVALNRVGLAGGRSNIDGSLQANGQVWIVNPNGVFFGRGAQVNVGGLIATTADIRDQDFNAGNYAFTNSAEVAGAGIVNKGAIVAASGGSVVLAGAWVKNTGLIQADLGTVELAAGKSFAVDFQGDKLIRFAVTAALDQTPVDKNGKPVDALITNSGTLSAKGGRVALTARAAKNVVDNVINTTGIIEATSVKKVNGEIVLDAGEDGGVQVAGSLDASGKGAGETGGSVTVTGGNVTLAATARIDVSGDAGGGAALIGGAAHGAGSMRHAKLTVAASGSRITADAVTSGNGGAVVLWSDGSTDFAGSISARGGKLGGDGGFVETSSMGSLAIRATALVDTLAPHGKLGSWLLDPRNITVQTYGYASLASLGSFAVAPGADFTVDPTAIDNARSNVTLQANNDITVNSAISMVNSGVGLTMQAGRSVLVNADITTRNGGVDLAANMPFNAAYRSPGAGGITMRSGTTIKTGFAAIDLLVGQAGPSGAITVDKLTTTGLVSIENNGFTNGSILAAGGGSLITAGSLSLDAGTFSGFHADDPGATIGSAALPMLVATPTLALRAGSDIFVTAPIGGFSTGTVSGNTGIVSTLGGQVSLSAPAGAITVASGAGITTTGNVTARASTLAVDGAIAGNDVTLSGSQIDLAANITTTGAVSFTGNTVLQSAVVIDTTAGGAASGGSIAFNGRLDDATPNTDSLNLVAGSGSITLSGDAGAINALGAMVLNSTGTTTLGGTVRAASLTTNLGGTTVLNGTVTTTGTQTYNDAVRLNADTLLNTTDAAVLFASTVDSFGAAAKALTVKAGSGSVTLTGDAGATNALGAMVLNSAGTTTLGGAVRAASLTTNAGGTTVLNGGTITTTVGQTYNDTVTLGFAGTTVASSTGSGDITFASTTDSAVAGTSGLTVNTAGTTTFGGSVGGIARLASLTTDAPGSTVIKGAVVSTTGGQTFNDTVTLGFAGTTVSSSTGVGPTGAITFALTMDSAIAGTSGLTVNTAGTTTLGGSVGGIARLASLTTDAPGSTVINGAVVSTTGVQAFNDTVTLGFAGTTVASSTGAGAITFASTTDSALAGTSGLTVNTAGATTFGGSVGGIARLASLTTDAPGSTAFNGAVVSTTGGQTFNDAVTLGFAGTTVSSSTGAGALGNITFASTTDSAVAGTSGLTVNTAGTTTFGGSVGGATPLSQLTIASAGAASLGPVTAGLLTQLAGAGTTVLNGPVLATGAGGISLNGSSFAVNGSLSTNAGNITITSTGAIAVTAPVIATGGDVTLSAGATLSVTNTTVRAQNTAADASTTGTVTGGGAATGSIVTAGAARTVALRAPGGDALPLPPAPLPPAPLPSVIPRNPGPPPLTLPPSPATTQGDSGGDSNAGLGSLNPQAGGDSSGGSGLTDSAPPAGYEGTADGLGQSAGYSPPPEKSGKGASSGSSGSGSGSQGSNGQGSSASGSGKRQITTVVLPGLVQTQGLPGTNARQDGGSGNGDVSLSADPGGWSQ